MLPAHMDAVASLRLDVLYLSTTCAQWLFAGVLVWCGHFLLVFLGFLHHLVDCSCMCVVLFLASAALTG